MEAMAEMLHRIPAAIERAASAPCLSAVSGDRPLLEHGSSPSGLNLLPSVSIQTSVDTPADATLSVETGPTTAAKERTDWRVTLAKWIWGRLWVKGRRRYVVLTLVVLLALGGLAIYLRHLEAQQCDCQWIQQQHDELRKNVLDQRRLLEIHQRWWEAMKRDATPRRVARSIVPSVQVMKDLLAKGFTRAEVVEYFREGRLPGKEAVVQDPNNVTEIRPDPGSDAVEVEKTSTETELVTTVDPIIDDLQVKSNAANIQAKEETLNPYEPNPVYRVGFETAHMTLCIATVLLSMGMILVVISKMSFRRRPRPQEQGLCEERRPMVEMASIVDASREPEAPVAPEAGLLNLEGLYHIDLGSPPSNRTSSASL